MKTKTLIIVIICLAMIGLNSCEQDYACETYYGESGNYVCSNNDGTYCTDGDKYAPLSRQKYYSGKTCQDIGYTATDSYSDYISPLGKTHAGSGSTMNGGGSTDGGSCSESNYAGPSTTSYGQSAPFCKQAWYYRNCKGLSLSSQEVSTNCNIYKNFENVPNCQYCQ